MTGFDARTMFRGTLLHADPPIIYSGMYAGQPEPTAFDLLAEALAAKEVVWLILVAWTAENTSTATLITEWRRSLMERYPRHRFVYLANTYAEMKCLRRLGNDCLFHHQNMFVDRQLFRPVASEKKYSAVYNAQFLPFKRHELCLGLEKLALIGYNFGNPHFAAVQQMLPNATYVNLDGNGQQLWLRQEKVNEVYNQSSVALCLSRNEGAMHASMEYLLSGLPVVTTLNAGGRDYFFDGRFVRWVEDSADAVAQAVASLEDECLDPSFIREETIRKIDRELDHFVEGISALLGIDSSKFRDSFEQRYCDKLITPRCIPDIVSAIDCR